MAYNYVLEVQIKHNQDKKEHLLEYFQEGKEIWYQIKNEKSIQFNKLDKNNLLYKLDNISPN